MEFTTPHQHQQRQQQLQRRSMLTGGSHALASQQSLVASSASGGGPAAGGGVRAMWKKWKIVDRVNICVSGRKLIQYFWGKYRIPVRFKKQLGFEPSSISFSTT